MKIECQKMAEDFYNLVSVAPNLEFSLRDQDICIDIPFEYRGLFQIEGRINPSIGDARSMGGLFR